MSRLIVRPEQLDLDSPGRRDYWVAMEHDHVWGDHLIPLTVFVGNKAAPGKGLVASGSNHGNEYEGPVALKHLLRKIDANRVVGRVILIPVLNPSAFRSGTRASVLDDGVNLNRAFVDGAGQHPALRGITHRIAKFFRDYIWPRVHAAIDLHSGGQVAAIAPCASFHPVKDPAVSAQMLKTAQWFGLPFVSIMTYQSDTPGLLPNEGERLGKIMIGTELGHGESVSPAGVRRAMHGVLAAAIHQQQLEGDIQPIDHHADGSQKRVTLGAGSITTAPWSGHYEPVVELGVPVRQGQLVARLHNFERMDEPPHEIHAQLDGHLFAHAWHARVTQGQHITIVAPPFTGSTSAEA